MGAFWIPRIELVATTSEIVGYKAGIALNRDDMIRLLGDGSDVEGEDEQLLRIRSEEFEEMVAQLLHAVGNIPRPEIGFFSVTVYHRHKHDKKELAVWEALMKALPDFLRRGIEEAKTSGRGSIDPTPFLNDALRDHGHVGASIALELFEELNLQQHRSPWTKYRREEWKDVAELKALFDSESLQTAYGTFFDQRFVDYLGQQFGDIDRIHWRKFEGLTCEFFERAGFRVEIGPGRDDGNVDARVWAKEADAKTPPTILVQCKRQKEKVGKVVVKALYADVLYEKANSGLIVTTTGLSPGAKKICTARAYPITGIDRDALAKWINLMRTPGNGVFMGE
jgi:restriction system protein